MPPTYLDDMRQSGAPVVAGSVTVLGHSVPREWFSQTWLEREEQWRLFRLCYIGGREFLQSRAPLTLFSHERESASSYADRARRAFYRNHCEAIVGLKADAIYQPQILRQQVSEQESLRRLVTREQSGDKSLEVWARDVDLQGTNADPWWNETARWAMVFGVEWAGIAMASAPDAEARAQAEGRLLTEEEARGAGIRPYLYRVSPLSVIDWAQDERGRLRYAVVLCQEADRAPLSKRTAMPAKPRLIARVLYPDHEERYLVGVRGGQQQIASFPHPFGEVPLVPVTIRPDWRSQLEDISRLAIAVFNEDSMVEEQIFRQTFNQLVAKVKERDAFMDNVTGTDALLTIGIDEAIDYLAPQVQTITTIQARAWELIDECYAMANLRSRPGGKGSQPATETSGIAYAFEHKNAETDLASIAARLEEAELKIGAMRARALRLDPMGFTCQYPRSFDVRALLTRAAEAQQLRNAGFGAKAMAEVIKNLVRQALPRLAAGRLAEIDQEIESRVNERVEVDGRAANRPPSQAMQPAGAGAGQDRMTRGLLAVGEEVEFDG